MKQYRKNCAKCHGTGIMQEDPIDIENNGGNNIMSAPFKCDCNEELHKSKRR